MNWFCDMPRVFSITSREILCAVGSFACARRRTACCGMPIRQNRNTIRQKRLMFLTVGQPYFISPRFLERLRKAYRDGLILKSRVVRFLGDVPDLTSTSQGKTLGIRD